jgi:hypothetical protein
MPRDTRLRPCIEWPEPRVARPGGPSLAPLLHKPAMPMRIPPSSPRQSGLRVSALLLLLALLALPSVSWAQGRVGTDSATRTRRYRHDVVYGTALGFAYAGVDQLRNDPVEWGRGWPGYERRLASNVGEFVIQETVTDLLAAQLDRQLDYQPCRCRGASRRIGWALQAAVTDPQPDGTHPVAVPRIVGAFAGSFAQAAWRPATDGASRTRVALVNGTTSLIVGAGINLYHEWRSHGGKEHRRE